MVSHTDLSEPTYRLMFKGLFEGLCAIRHDVRFLASATDVTPEMHLIVSHIHNAPGTEHYELLDAAGKAGVPRLIYVNDFEVELRQQIANTLEQADGLVAPTSMHRAVLASLSDKPIYVLREMIDPALPATHVPKSHTGGPLRVLWFGFPQSYARSMNGWHDTLVALARDDLIHYTICSRGLASGKPTRNVRIIEYSPDHIANVLNENDCCVLSHIPLDFQLTTFSKSENKLTLAIAAGLVCVASRTPAYMALLAAVGMDRYAVAEPHELALAIRELSRSEARLEFVSRAQSYVVANYSQAAVVKDFVAIARSFLHTNASRVC